MSLHGAHPLELESWHILSCRNESAHRIRGFFSEGSPISQDPADLDSRDDDRAIDRYAGSISSHETQSSREATSCPRVRLCWPIRHSATAG